MDIQFVQTGSNTFMASVVQQRKCADVLIAIAKDRRHCLIQQLGWLWNITMLWTVSEC